MVVEFGEEFVEAIVAIFSEADTVDAGSQSACGGDSSFGDFACEQQCSSEEADACGDRGREKGEVGGVAGLAEAFCGDVAFEG